MAHPYDALYFREIMGRMFGRLSDESLSQAFMVAPIDEQMSRQERSYQINQTRMVLAHALDTSEVFYTSSEITERLLRRSQELTAPGLSSYRFLAEDFPTRLGLAYFDHPIPIPTAYPEKWVDPASMDNLRAVMWSQYLESDGAATGKIMWTFVDNRHVQPKPVEHFHSPWLVRHSVPMKYGEPLDPKSKFRNESMSDFEGYDLSPEERARMLERQQAALDLITRLLYTWTQFLQTEIISAPRTEVPPDHARVMKKSGRPLPLFRTVVLRHAVSLADHTPELVGPVNWRHRWKVREHWRNQRVGPNREYIRPTLVAEHWKGPEHLPKDERDTVQAIVR